MGVCGSFMRFKSFRKLGFERMPKELFLEPCEDILARLCVAVVRITC